MGCVYTAQGAPSGTVAKGQVLEITWTPEMKETVGPIFPGGTFGVRVYGPYPSVNEAKVGYAHGVRPGPVAASSVVIGQDVCAAQPASIRLPPDMAAGWYNLETSERYGNFGSSGAGLIQVLP